LIIGEVCELALSFDGNFLFAGLSDGSIVMLNVKTKEKVKHFKDIHSSKKSIEMFSSNK